MVENCIVRVKGNRAAGIEPVACPFIHIHCVLSNMTLSDGYVPDLFDT